MKSAIFLFILSLFFFSLTTAQTKTYRIKADSLIVSSDCDTAELVLRNRTKAILNGVLTNKGDGVTEFRKVLQKVNDSTYLVGADTLKLFSPRNAWLLGGNITAGLQTIGTKDSIDLPIVTANREQLRVKANGNIGIGTATPLQKLHVTGANGASVQINPNLSGPRNIIVLGGRKNAAGSDDVILSASNDSGATYKDVMTYTLGRIGLGIATPNIAWYGSNPALRINFDGRVAIVNNDFSFGPLAGAYNSSSLLFEVSTYDEWEQGANVVKSLNNFYYIGTKQQAATGNNKRAPLKISGRDLLFLTGFPTETEVMTVKDGGNIGIGITTPTQKLEVAGTIKASGLLLPAGAGNGLVLTSDASGNASWQSPGVPSDASLKENIETSDFDPAVLNQLLLKEFNYKTDPAKTRYVGLIAQELKTILPELVLGNEGNYSIDYQKMVPYLLKALQEQQRWGGRQDRELQTVQAQLKVQAAAITELTAELKRLKRGDRE